jgi:hypothetical protein
VVASICDAARKYQSWRERYWGNDTIHRAVTLWNRGVAVSMKYSGKRNNCVIGFDSLITRPNDVLFGLTQFLGVQYEEVMSSYSIDGLIKEDEHWKENVNGGIYIPESKFEVIFTKDEQRYVKARLRRFAESHKRVDRE